ncbi:hypothetical protein HDE_06203 [Halotydeus destructor]|nr:hypothetical protein HDE_06203 [Halotydeus destructor]
MVLHSKGLEWTIIAGFFVIAQYYSNFMLNQIVGQEKPDVLQYFQDILRPEASIRFSTENNAFSDVQQSTNPLIVGIRNKIRDKKTDDLMLKNGITSFQDLYSLKDRHLALVGSYNTMTNTKILGCAMMARVASMSAISDNEKYAIWVPGDGPQQYLNAILFSGKLDKKVREVIDQAMLRYAEQGAVEKTYLAEKKERSKTLVRMVSRVFPKMMENSSAPTDCKINGLTGYTVPMFAKRLGFNCSATVDYIGQPSKSGNYSGIIGQLQFDMADFSATPLRIPLEGDPIKVGHVVFSDRFSFLTVYKVPEAPTNDFDLIESFRQIDSVSWISLTFLLLISLVLLKLQGNRNPLMDVVRYLLQLSGFQSSSVSSKILGITMLVGFFVLSMFYSNFMLTEIVRQEKPNVLEHFFDMLRPEAKICAFRADPSFRELKKSSSPKFKQIRHKLRYEKHLKMGSNINGVSKVLYGLRRQLFAILGYYNTMRNSRIVACAIMARASSLDPKADEDKFATWVPNDAPQQFLLAMSYNKRLDEKIRQVIDIAALRYAEQSASGTIDFKRAFDTSRDTWFPEKLDPACFSDTILTEENDSHRSLTLGNAQILLFSLLLIHLASFVLLIAEKFMYRLQRSPRDSTHRQRVFVESRKWNMLQTKPKRDQEKLI